jgi:hypothetical protein
VSRRSNALVRQYGGTWNTYYNHPKGYWLDDVSVDHWGRGGRGGPIGQRRGDSVSAAILKRREDFPVAWLIWYGRWWRPGIGWAPYTGFSGMHYDHVHVTYYRYSRTCGCWPHV